MTTTLAALDSRPRNRDWLFALARLAPPNAPRTRRYLKQILAADRPLDLPDPRPQPRDGQGAYHVSRGGSALIGRKAFLFRTPGTPLYLDPRVLDDVLDGMKKFRDSQHRRGDFVWGDAWSRWLPHHEHTWRTEPLLWARLWLDDFLRPADKRWIDGMLRRAATWLFHFELESPNDTVQYCNRGPVWLTGMTLCGLYFEDRRFLDKVEQYAPAVMRGVINDRGEVLENYLHYTGGGPDTGSYSYTAWIYAMMYRLLSGRSDFDDRMIGALRWLAHFTTRRGYPVAPGASVRSPAVSVLVEDMLGGYEFYAPREPVFHDIAGRLIGAGRPHAQGHCVHPCIWAMLCHTPHVSGSRRRPAWHAAHEGHYDHQSCSYSLFTRRYQTAATWRSLFPLKGIQSFAWGDEPPIIHPAAEAASSTLVWGVDTAADNIDAGANGWELFRRTAGAGDGYEPANPATVITTRRGRLWECYVFTRDTVVYAAGGQRGRIASRWVLNDQDPAQPRIDRRRRQVSFAGRRACMRYVAGRAALRRRGSAQTLELSSPLGAIAVALGGPGLMTLRLDRRRSTIALHDATGRYAIDLGGIVADDQHLDRQSWHRVRRLP